jgi:transcriptional regulator with XRE-family HTH domain
MKNEQELKRLGKKISDIRIKKGMSRYELAKKAGKPYPSIDRVEKGKTNPSYLLLLLIAETLKVEMIEFFK